MRVNRVALAAIALTAMTGFALPADTMPPNTVMLSQMMRELSTQPGFTEAFLAEIEGGKKQAGRSLLRISSTTSAT